MKITIEDTPLNISMFVGYLHIVMEEQKDAFSDELEEMKKALHLILKLQMIGSISNLSIEDQSLYEQIKKELI